MRSKNKNFIIYILVFSFCWSAYGQQEKQNEIIIPDIGNTAWWSGGIN